MESLCCANIIQVDKSKQVCSPCRITSTVIARMSHCGGRTPDQDTRVTTGRRSPTATDGNPGRSLHQTAMAARFFKGFSPSHTSQRLCSRVFCPASLIQPFHRHPGVFLKRDSSPRRKPSTVESVSASIRQWQGSQVADQKLNLSANWPCLPGLAEVTLPKLNGSLTLEAGAPKICRLKALNISKRSSMFMSS
jgi:hypothetical protein